MTYANPVSRISWKHAGLVAALGAVLLGGTPSAIGAEGPSLGAARSFGVLGASTVENSGLTVVTGDVGVYPGTSIIGFGPGEGVVLDGALHPGDALAATAHNDAALAYNFLAGMATIPANELTGLDLGGMTLAPGVYYFTTSAQLTGTLTLDAMGDSSAVFVFKIGSTLTTASGAVVNVINGGADYDESKVFWQVGSSATLGSSTAFTGNILASASISIVSGSSMRGNALAINGSVTLDSNVVASPVLIAAGPAIAAPVNLTAELDGSPVVPGASLAWEDASTNETEFRVYRRTGAGPDWTLIATVPSTTTVDTGGLYAYEDPGLETMKIYSYRVTAFEATPGESLPSNEALVDTGVFNPLELTAVLTEEPAVTGADLTWTDVSDNETEFRVYRKDGTSTDFVLVGTVPSDDTPGTGTVVTFNDPVLDFLSTFTYRVTAYSLAGGESAPSNEVLLSTVFGPSVRWLDVHLGRSRSIIRNRTRTGGDRIFLRGSFVVIDVASEVPTVLPTQEVDPRIGGIAIQVRAPGSIYLLTIPADDAGWKVNKKGVYRWKSGNGASGPISNFRIDTRKSEFQLNARKIDFPVTPLNEIMVSLTSFGATGSDARVWEVRLKEPAGSGQRFSLPK